MTKNLRSIPVHYLLMLLLLLSVGCQKIVPDLKVVSETNTDSDTTTIPDTNTGTDTESSSDTNSDGSGDTNSDTGSDTNSDIDTALTPRDICAQNGGYWYDANDVLQTTAAGFDALVPECHDIPTENCTDSIVWAMLQNGTMLSEPTTTTSLSYNGSEEPVPVTRVFSTVRCMANLTSISLQGNRVETVDLLNNERLEFINFYTNQNLSWIGLPRSDSVRELHFNDNRLTSLDLSHFTYLERLYLANNNISAIDLSGLEYLEYANLGQNKITGHIDVSQSIYLETLRVDENQISELTLPTTADYLTELRAGDNPNLATLNLSACTALRTISVSGPGVSQLNLESAGDHLTHVHALDSNLTSLNLTRNPNIVEVQVYGSILFTELQLAPETPSLQLLYLNGTLIKSLNISGADNLHTLHAQGDGLVLTHLDFSQKHALYNTMLSGHNFSQSPVDLSDCDAWQEIDLSDNRIEEIILPTNGQILTLDLSNNNISEIQIQSPTVTAIDLSNNRLNYSGTGTNVFRCLSCLSLQTLTINGNPALRLNISATEFPREFLNSPASRIYMDSNQWTNVHVGAVDWIFDEAEGCARLNQK